MKTRKENLTESAETEPPQDGPRKHGGNWIVWCVVLLFALIVGAALALSLGATIGEVTGWATLIGFFVATCAFLLKVMRKNYRREPRTRTLAWEFGDYDDSPPAPPSNI
jgi:hypothetical protein